MSLADDLHAELDRQIDTLVGKDYPALAGISEDVFRKQLAPLHDAVPSLPDPTGDNIPFFVVITSIAPEAAIGKVVLKTKPGFTSMEQSELVTFQPTEDVSVPDAAAYLAADISLGPDTLNIPPQDVLPSILEVGRSPLTIDEGLAVVTQQPAVLRERNAFSLLGSRCGDKRVPAIWVSANAARLGWCWNGAPHTWLGSASLANRLA